MQNVLRANGAPQFKLQSKSSKPLFISPKPAGRRITAGFSYLQRIGKAASIDVWFPAELRKELDTLLAKGARPGDEHFPAEWAAVRQFELLQEAGNYKIYDLDPTYLTRTLTDLTRNMRGGGYRVTVVTIGSYDESGASDELAILDRTLQDRISHLINMLYLEEQSEQINATLDKKLLEGTWDYQNALPHVGVTLGAGDLFRRSDRKQELARQFFEILGYLPQNHIVHDTAVGLQLPELIGEHQWIYIARDGEKFFHFSALMGDLFGAPAGHMRGYGDRLTPDADRFYRNLAQFTMH